MEKLDIAIFTDCVAWYLTIWTSCLLEVVCVSMPNLLQLRYFISWYWEGQRMYGCIFRSAEQLYGSQFLTLNMHLHLHLPECFQDYGPCYSFWLFSFERYNVILGRYHTNHRSIEIQLMQKFMENMHMKSLHGEWHWNYT